MYKSVKKATQNKGVRFDTLRSLLYFYRHLTSLFRKMPDVVIIGAQKSGTTSLYNYLQESKQVRKTFNKEVHFFNHSDNYSKGLLYYASFFPTILTHWFYTLLYKKSISIDASPEYLPHPLAAARISRYLPHSKLIVILRNPIERAYSQYHHRSKLGFPDTTSFSEAIRNEEARLNPEHSKVANGEDDFWLFNYGYKYNGLYFQHLSRWLSYFSKDRLLILTMDELQTTPQDCINRVCDFIDIETFPLSNPKTHNKGKERDTMPTDDRSYLQDFFKDDMEQLSQLIQQDLNWK